MSAKQIAFLIDAENMMGDLKEISIDQRSRVDKIAEHIDNVINVEKQGEILIKFAYADWANYLIHKAKIADFYIGHGISTKQCDSPSAKKNSSDMALAIDVIDMFHTQKIVPDIYYIYSGDGDFTPLVLYLRARGKVVHVRGIEGQSSKKLMNSSSSYISIISPSVNPNLTPQPDAKHEQTAITATNIPPEIQIQVLEHVKQLLGSQEKMRVSEFVGTLPVRYKDYNCPNLTSFFKAINGICVNYEKHDGISVAYVSVKKIVSDSQEIPTDPIQVEKNTLPQTPDTLSSAPQHKQTVAAPSVAPPPPSPVKAIPLEIQAQVLNHIKNVLGTQKRVLVAKVGYAFPVHWKGYNYTKLIYFLKAIKEVGIYSEGLTHYVYLKKNSTHATSSFQPQPSVSVDLPKENISPAALPPKHIEVNTNTVSAVSNHNNIALDTPLVAIEKIEETIPSPEPLPLEPSPPITVRAKSMTPKPRPFFRVSGISTPLLTLDALKKQQAASSKQQAASSKQQAIVCANG